MIELQSKDDIEKISFDLLKQSNSLGVFPTPVDNIVRYSDLVIAKDVNLAHVDDSFFEKTSTNIVALMQKVRGFLDRRKKIIYLDLNQSTNRKNFVKLHETGHDILPWQREIMAFIDNDSTLDPLTDEEFEAEANYFASTTLFQFDRFDKEISQLPLGLGTVKHLSQKFGASIHATFRRYIERSKKRCALLVLKNNADRGKFAKCEVRNYFQSANFTEEFGFIDWSPELDGNWKFVQDYCNGRRYHMDGYVSITIVGVKTQFKYHFFNSSYNAFVFLYPIGEKVKSRTEFIFKS